jgi:hypothetical protein
MEFGQVLPKHNGSIEVPKTVPQSATVNDVPWVRIPSRATRQKGLNRTSISLAQRDVFAADPVSNDCTQLLRPFKRQKMACIIDNP